MTDLPMMLLNRLGPAPLQPAGPAIERDEDIIQTFQSSLEALVEVFDDLLDDEIPVKLEPSNIDQTAASMMMLVTSPCWDPWQTRMGTPHAAAVPPPPQDSRGLVPLSNPDQALAYPVPAHQSTANSVTSTCSPKESIVPSGEQQPTPCVPMETEYADAVAVEESEIQASPASDVAVPGICASKAFRQVYSPQDGSRQVPPESHEDAIPNATRQEVHAPTGRQEPPPIRTEQPNAVGDPDAMFLPSPHPAVRNPVPSRARSEQTAFEVEISDEADKSLHLGEPSVISTPKPVNDKSDVDDCAAGSDTDGGDKRAAAAQGSTLAASDNAGDTKVSNGEAFKASALSAPAPSTTRDGGSAIRDAEPPASRSTTAPAERVHPLEKPKPFHASTGIQLRVGPRENVSIHVNQIAGNVRIAVRSIDPELTRELQAGVPDLLAVLNETGVRAEATIPDIGSPIAEGKESTVSNIASGSPGSSHESSRDADGGSSGQHRRHRRPEQRWKEWLEER